MAAIEVLGLLLAMSMPASLLSVVVLNDVDAFALVLLGG